MRRAFIITFFEFFSSISQFLYFLLWGFYFGTRSEMDSFLVSMTWPVVLGTIATAPLISTLIPFLVESRRELNSTEFVRLKNILFNMILSCGIAICVILYVGAKPIVHVSAPGLTLEKYVLAVSLFKIELFSIPLMIVVGLLNSYYYLESRFTKPTVIPIFGTGCSIAILFFFHTRLGVFALAWGMLANAFIQVLLLISVMKEYSFVFNFSHPHIIRFFRRFSPLLAGNLYYKSDLFFERFIASFLPNGSISYLGYGNRITTTINQALTRGFVTTRFTDMSENFYHRHDEFIKNIDRTLNQIMFVLVPTTILMVMFSKNLIHLFLERGAFFAKDTANVALVVICFSGIVVGGVLGSLMANIFYVMGEVKTITLVGIIMFTLGIVFKVVGGAFGSCWGVAFATSLYYLCTLAVEVVIIQSRKKLFNCKAVFFNLMKLTISGGFGSVIVLSLHSKLKPQLLFLLVSVTLFLIIFVVFSFFLNVPEARRLIAYVKKHGLCRLREPPI